jgi:hypothetical protein
MKYDSQGNTQWDWRSFTRLVEIETKCYLLREKGFSKTQENYYHATEGKVEKNGQDLSNMKDHFTANEPKPIDAGRRCFITPC